MQSRGGECIIFSLAMVKRIIMTIMTKKFKIALILAVLAHASIAEAALQTISGEKYASPLLESPFPLYSILYALVGLAGVAIVGFKNSGRTHLD